MHLSMQQLQHLLLPVTSLPRPPFSLGLQQRPVGMRQRPLLLGASATLRLMMASGWMQLRRQVTSASMPWLTAGHI